MARGRSLSGVMPGQSCSPPLNISEIPDEVDEPVDAKADIDSVDVDVNSLDKQLDDSSLLGGEEFVP